MTNFNYIMRGAHIIEMYAKYSSTNYIYIILCIFLQT